MNMHDRIINLQLGIALIALVLNLSGRNFVLGASCPWEIKLVSSTPTDIDKYGESVAIDGSNIVIGAYLADIVQKGYLQAGTAYVVHESTQGVWNEVAKLEASDGKSGDQFGNAVCISGTNLGVAAAKHDGQSTFSSGAVYVFSESFVGVWDETAILVADDAATNNEMGTSVAMEGSSTIIAGAPNANSVYVFRESSPGIWSQVAKLVSSVGSGSFGKSVDSSGTRVVAGSFHEAHAGYRSGAAYIFTESSPGVWIETTKLVPSDANTEDYFGTAVAIDGENVVVGAPYNDDGGDASGSAYVFSELSPGVWTEVAKLLAYLDSLEDHFGNAVTIQGTAIVIGASWDNHATGWNVGSARLFIESPPGTWEEVETFTGQNPETYDYYATSVALDNGVVVIGAPSDDPDGSAYIHYFSGVVDDCIGHLCEHGATCVDRHDDYCCDCPQSHNGTLCESCACRHGGICQDDVDTGIGYCDCTNSRWAGKTCNSKFCNNGYSEEYPSLKCNCTGSGATGNTCHEDIDDCTSNPCMNGGTCSDYGALLFPDGAHQFNCSCPIDSPFIGPVCNDTMCVSNPCMNNGTCINGVDSACNCTATGYEGEFCQTEIDECASSPCENGATCTDHVGKFECDCANTGYDGISCSDDLNDCASSPCENDGVCKDKGANKYQCTCNEFWEGKKCTKDIDDCILRGYECENGGTCTDDPVNMGEIICNCSNAATFIGQFCEIPFEEDNACDLYNPCQYGGRCYTQATSVACDCSGTGFTGDYCDIFSFNSDCVSSPCLHQGRCFDDETTEYTCDCTDTGYHGDNCEIEYCTDVICENGGTCMEDICTCTSDFTGEYCAIQDDNFILNNRSSSSSSSGFDQAGGTAGGPLVVDDIDCGSTGKQEIVMIGMAGVSGMAILNWLVLREFPFFKNGIKETPSTSQRLFFMMMFVFTLFDFITDVGFVDYVTNACESDLDDVDVFASVAGTVLGVSAVANMLVLLFLTSRDETKSFQKHLSKYTVMTCFAMLVSCANMSAILLLDSNLLGLRGLTGGFPTDLKNKIKLYAMGTGLLQNLPQLITQGTFITQGGPANTVTLSSVSFSGILMLITIVRVIMIVCTMLNNGTKKKDEAYKLPR